MTEIKLDPITTSAGRSLDPATIAQGDPKDAAKKFQALLSTMLVKEMRASLGEGGFFGKGADGDVYGGWLDQSIGQSLADRDALHLEGVLRESLERKALASGGTP